MPQALDYPRLPCTQAPRTSMVSGQVSALAASPPRSPAAARCSSAASASPSAACARASAPRASSPCASRRQRAAHLHSWSQGCREKLLLLQPLPRTARMHSTCSGCQSRAARVPGRPRLAPRQLARLLPQQRAAQPLAQHGLLRRARRRLLLVLLVPAPPPPRRR